MQPLKAKLPPSKQKAVTPTVKTYSAVSAIPTKSQPPSSATNFFSFSPDNSLKVVSTSKACSSTTTKPRLASLPVESSYYHEIDSDFLDFDSWSPVNMLTPLSPPDHDIQGTHSRATDPPQPTSYRREALSTVQTNVKGIPPARADQNNNKQFTNTTKQTQNNNKQFTNMNKQTQNNNKQFTDTTKQTQNNNKQFTNMTKQTNTIVKTSSISKNDPCSFFTAGSTK